MGLLLSLQVMRRGEVIAQHAFDSDAHRLVRVGKRPADHIPLHDITVAQVRARITLSADEAILLDLGTTGGISVNGFKVREAQLRSNDQIVIGQTTLVVTSCAPAYLDASNPFGAMGDAAVGPARGASEVDQKLRVVAKISALSPELLSAAERLIDDLAAGAHTAAPTTRFEERPADPWSDAFAQNPNPNARRSSPPPTSPPSFPVVSAPSPEPAPWPGRMATGDFDAAALVPPGVGPLATDDLDPPAAPVRREKYDTDYLVSSMQRARWRTPAIAVGAAALAVVLTVLVTRSDDASPTPSADAATAPDGASGAAAPDGAAPEPTAPAAAPSGPSGAEGDEDTAAAPSGPVAPPPAITSDDEHLAYTFAQERSLAELAQSVWGTELAADYLVRKNPEVTGPDVVLPAGTTIRIPRSARHTVAPGESLGSIAQSWLGDVRLYKDVHSANQERMPTPDAVEIGMEIAIPLLGPRFAEKLTAPR